jgi:hypothetical protein
MITIEEIKDYIVKYDHNLSVFIPLFEELFNEQELLINCFISFEPFLIVEIKKLINDSIRLEFQFEKKDNITFFSFVVGEDGRLIQDVPVNQTLYNYKYLFFDIRTILQNEITEEIFKFKNSNLKIKYTFYEKANSEIEKKYYLSLSPLFLLSYFTKKTIKVFKPWLST